VERKIKATVKQRIKETWWKKGINVNGEKGKREEGKIMERKRTKINIKTEMQKELLNMKEITQQESRTEAYENIFRLHFFLPERTTLLIE